MQILAKQLPLPLLSPTLLPSDLTEQTSTRTLWLVDDTEQAFPNLSWFLASINALPDVSLLVVSYDRGGLLMVGNEALLQSIGIVVGPLDQRLASDIIFHGLLGRIEDLVV